MRFVQRSVLAIAAAFLAMLSGISPPASATGSPSFGFGPPLYNVAAAYSAWPQRPSLREAWMVAEPTWPSVVAVNAAHAVTENCTGCEVAAVAFQVVIASDVGALTLTNNASTIQTNCVSCDSAAVAEQWVVASTSERLLLTDAGKAALLSVHLQLSHLLYSGATPSQIADDAFGFEAEINAILSQDVVTAPGRPRSPPLPLPAGKPLVADSVQSLTVTSGSGTVTSGSGFTIYHYSQVCAGPTGCSPPAS
jgi:hypothetical protein